MPQVGERRVSKDRQWVATWNGNSWVELPNRDLSQNLSKDEDKLLGEIRRGARNARAAYNQASEFWAMNDGRNTGGLLGIPGVAGIVGAIDPAISTMTGLSERMIPNMHVTPGPMTDADALMYRRTVPNPKLPRQTNQNMSIAIRDQMTEHEAQAAFYDRWAQARGTLNGADAAWGKFWEAYKANPPPGSPRIGEAQPRKPRIADPNVRAAQRARGGQGSTFKYLGSEE